MLDTMNLIKLFLCVFILVKSTDASCFVNSTYLTLRPLHFHLLKDCRYINFFDFGIGVGDKQQK